MEQALPYIWLSVVVLAAGIEAATTQMVSIWFAAGGVCALIAGLLDGPMWLQVTVFVIVTILTLVLTRPLVRRINRREKVKTNADRYVGQTGKVIVTIDNQQGTGQVKIEGSIWSARTSDGSQLSTGENVVVEEIQGVKLLVHKQ